MELYIVIELVTVRIVRDQIHVLMSNACCSRLVGPTLAALVRMKVLALVSDLSVPLPNDEEINNALEQGKLKKIEEDVPWKVCILFEL